MRWLMTFVLVTGLACALAPLGTAGGDKKDGDKKVSQKDGDKKDGDKKDGDKKDGKKDGEKKGDKQADNLDGTWVAVAIESKGKKVPDEFFTGKRAVRMVIKGKTFVQTDSEHTTKGTFAADPSKTPKEVDAFFTDQLGNKVAVKSIYELKDDTMRVCGARDKDRPKEFVTTAENGLEMVTWKREKK